MNEGCYCSVIGDAMIDIIIPVNDDINFFLNINNDLINVNSKIVPGGLLNVAVLLSQLGIKTSFTGKVGCDYFGSVIKKDASKNNVISNISESILYKTGMVFDLVFENGERKFIVDRGANNNLTISDVNFNLFEQSHYFYASGFSCQDKKSFDTVEKVFDEYSSYGKTIVFNVGSSVVARKYTKQIQHLVKSFSNILILNMEEGEILTDTNDAYEISQILLDYSDKIILTRGCDGSLIATKKEIITIKSDPTKPLDTTGAGDSYASAYLAALISGHDDNYAAHYASKVACNMVKIYGARFDKSNIINF